MQTRAPRLSTRYRYSLGSVALAALAPLACAADAPKTNGPSATGEPSTTQSVAPPSEVAPSSEVEPSRNVTPQPSDVAPTQTESNDSDPGASSDDNPTTQPSSASESGITTPTEHDAGQPPSDTGSSGSTSDAGPGPVEAGAERSAVVYVGGYDYASEDYPFRIYDLDKLTGELSMRAASVDAGPNPSYIAAFGRTLYVANERDDQLGGLTALSIGDDGSLTRLNHQTGSDGGFTYVGVDPQGRFALGASYNGGSVSLFSIEQDGALGPELDVVDFGNNAQSHSVGFDSAGDYVLVPNKGIDEVAQLVLGADGSLEPNTPAATSAASGSGPRHIAVSPSGDLVWVINELSSTLTSYQLDAGGILTSGTTISTLPDGYAGQNTAAHLEVSADGRFVYASNRGHDSIAVFAVDAVNGDLTLVEHESTGGATPRGFNLDPLGDVAIVANQDSGTLTVLAIQEDGSLQPTTPPVTGPPSPAAVEIVYLP